MSNNVLYWCFCFSSDFLCLPWRSIHRSHKSEWWWSGRPQWWFSVPSVVHLWPCILSPKTWENSSSVCLLISATVQKSNVLKNKVTVHIKETRKDEWVVSDWTELKLVVSTVGTEMHCHGSQQKLQKKIFLEMHFSAVELRSGLSDTFSLNH